MVDLVLVLACLLGVALAIADDRLTRLNRRMPLADFEEVNLIARCLTGWLGEDAGWTAMQAAGMTAFVLLIAVAFLHPWIDWAVVCTLSAGLALVSFDYFHDGREMRLAVTGGYGLRHSMD